MMFTRKAFYIAVIVVLAAAGVAIGLPLWARTSPVATDPPAVHAQAGQQAGEKLITVAPPMTTGAVWVTKVTVGNKFLVPYPNPKAPLAPNQVLSGQAFFAGSNWLQDMVVYLLNRTDKNIAWLQLSIRFPQTGNGRTHPVWAYGLQLGRMPAVDAINGRTGKPGRITPGAKPLEFRPGQTLAIHIGDYMGKIKAYLKTSAVPFVDISKCYVTQMAMFNDGLIWNGDGSYQVPDKAHPGRRKNLPSGYFPGNMHRYPVNYLWAGGADR